MAAKKVQISDDGSTWYTFPGDTGDLQTNGTAIKDTVFGEDFESSQTGMLEWTMSANGMYKGFAGYVATIKKAGTSTALTAEACGLLSTRVYQVTNVAHQVLDRTVALVVKDGSTDVTADVLSIDYLFGIITFKGSYTVLGSITIDSGNYWPMAQIAKAQTFSLTQTAATIDDSDFVSAQGNGGYKTMGYGLYTIALDLTGIYAVSNAWLAALVARSEVMVEICPDGNNKSRCRGIFKPMTEGQSGAVGALEAESVKMSLSVPDPSNYPLLTAPFSWRHDSGTTLSVAIQKALTAFFAGNNQEYFQYLYDGTNGQSGQGVITDITLTGGLDVMNTFAMKISGAGATTAVGTG
jgi:hypothetical protein